MSLRTLRVAAVQLDCRGPVALVSKRALQMCRRAARDGARVVCLPEHWVRDSEEGIGKLVSRFEEVARDEQMFVVIGGEFARGSTGTFVDAIIIGPKGEVGRQHKVHLFASERKRAIPGDDYKIFDLGGVMVGVAICHDLVYPEVARILALGGAEVIFAPARIGSGGLEPWRLYVQTRALENRVPIVSPNVLQPPKFRGGSMIVGLWRGAGGIVYPEVLADAGSRPGLVAAEIDLVSIRRWRAERLRARRPETYSGLVSRF